MKRHSFTFLFANCILIAVIFLLGSCRSHKRANTLFQVLEEDKTGIYFSNKLRPTKEFNLFDYMYFYNGAGVGAGDFNNDGKIDLFFAANQTSNKLYLNKGNMSFTDVTQEAMIPVDGGWSTGVSVVDINNDGLLDIYVCRVGDYEVLKSKNQLLVCKGIKNGIPYYTDEASKYGLDFSGFSTQALFFDYDRDGDLDMYLLNHSVYHNGMINQREKMLQLKSAESGDRLYRNEGGTFTDVTKESGIINSEMNYGLGIAASDINLDGWPDLYIGNDFHENDYLYINQKNGTFKDESNQHLMHTSLYSMGVDVADANNDGFPEIVSMDMLPSDAKILKRSLGEDNYDIFFQKIRQGYNYQYTRNNLQFNRRNGMFSETGLYSGVAATDWSWAPLWMDFDNDGLKDLFISNGIPKRMNDMDYVNFIASAEGAEKMQDTSGTERMDLIEKFPQIKIPNKFYHNKGDLSFDDWSEEMDNIPTYSNGAVYADLDNDGDLDIVVNNVDDPVLVYENKSKDSYKSSFAEISLKGSLQNISAVGAKIILFANNSIRTYENYPVKGFLSSMQIPMHIGLKNTKIDSAFLIWPDNSCERIHLSKGHNSFVYSKDLPQFDYSIITYFHQNTTRLAQDITSETGLIYKHTENSFLEFNREPLMPRMLSTEGPALAVADINSDGLEDVFIGASAQYHSAVFVQQANGKFVRTLQPELMKDSLYEDVDAAFTDVNNDGSMDLIVASGGNENAGKDEHSLPRVYLNDGKGALKKLQNAFTGLYETYSCIRPYDFNNDGFVDVFLGGRTVPDSYGQIPRSHLLQNDGTGKFVDVTESYSKELSQIGMVTSAVWFDLDKDGDKDLLLCCEWGGIECFINNNRNFVRKQLTGKKGWWNFILPADVNNDGNIDLVAGNFGLNGRLNPSAEEPVRMYYNDFDDNGKKDQLLTYYLNHRELPFANKEELQRQMPQLRKKFFYAADFAKASVEELFPKNKLKESQTFSADYFSNAVLINDGKMNFSVKPLPWEAQLTTFRDASIIDANNDDLSDILLAGNFYENNVQMGRNDADFGTILVNKGKGDFACEPLNGLTVKGQVRHIQNITLNKSGNALILAKNNDSAMVIRFIPKK